MKTINIPYAINQRVDLRNSGGVEATIVGIQICSDGVTYMCRWMHNGEYKEQWLTATEIEGKRSSTKIGFKEEDE